MVKEEYPEDYEQLVKIEYIIEQYFIFRDIEKLNLGIDSKDLSYHDFNCFRYIDGVCTEWRAEKA